MKDWERYSPGRRKLPGRANRESRQRLRKPIEAGGVDVLDESWEGFEEAVQAKKNRLEVVAKTRDALSISLPIRSGSDEIGALERYLNDVERRSQGGRVVSLGEMACQLASPNALFAMMNEAYPDAFSDPHRARRLQRDFARDFNMHVREQRQLWSDLDFIHGSPKDMDDANLSQAMKTARGWEQDGHYVQPDTFAYKGEYFGLSLSENESLYDSFQFVKNYLAKQHLNVSYLTEAPESRRFEPHLPLYIPSEGEYGINKNVVIRAEFDVPVYIPLHPPAARVH